MTPDDPRHGTTNGYTNLACRCQPCRDAHAARTLARRLERARLEPPVHGLSTTYTNWACRCDACRTAHATYYREQRARRRAA